MRTGLHTICLWSSIFKHTHLHIGLPTNCVYYYLGLWCYACTCCVSVVYTDRPNDPDAFSRTLTGRKSGNQKLEESLSSRLKLCCGYHWQMERQRSQSCTLVTGVDAGYDGDSDSSSDERAPLEPIPVVALRPSYQKRLMWRLANSHF